jgi:dipeptidyl aminopeptidase/acylaminoacyl peptidase
MTTSTRRLFAVTVLTAGLAAVTPASATRIAFTSLGLHSHVLAMDGDGTNKLALTSGAVDDVSPTWSPSGSHLVFVRRRPNGSDDLYRIQADGTGLTQITRTDAAEANPVWSPLGRRLVCEFGSLSGSFEIVVMNADGTGRKRLTRNRVDDVEPVSVSLRARATRRQPTGPTRGHELLPRRPAGGGGRRLTGAAASLIPTVWASV